MLEIKALNTPEELQRFPLAQSIYLECTHEIEDAYIRGNIVLIRNQKDYGSFNNSDLRNHNIGYIKEKFSTIDMAVSKHPDDPRKLICDPKEPLAPNSSYTLFIAKDTSKEHLELTKTVSKGPSQLELVKVSTQTDVPIQQVYEYIIDSKPLITATSNVVKVRLKVDGTPIKTFTINAKSDKNEIFYGSVTVRVLDTAYAEGEEFKLEIDLNRQTLKEDLVLDFTTVASSQIKPIENIQPSHTFSPKDVLEFYEKLDSEKAFGIDFRDENWQEKEFRIEYLSDNQFFLHLSKLSAGCIDFDNMTVREFPAFNRTELYGRGLYDPKHVYRLVPEILEDKLILFTVEEVL